MKIYEQIGLDFIFDNLKLITPLGKKRLKNLKLIADRDKIEKEFDDLEEMTSYHKKNLRKIEVIERKLKEIQDITPVIKRLKEGSVLDDIDLFQIKIFSMLSQNIFEIIEDELPSLSPGNLEKVIDLLDPDKIRIGSFHIYSSYSPELHSIRDEIKTSNNSMALYEMEMEIEEKIRKELSRKLRVYGDAILHAEERIANIDLLIAKVVQIKELNLKRPVIGEKTAYCELFNPKVLKGLEKNRRAYQKIDFSVENGVTVITGANMSGKTLTLKTVALCQYLCQMGFFLPVSQGEVALVQNIFLSIGDYQSLESGLSSYAAEILAVDEILKSIRSGAKPLVLIDELARTTNPKEGKAIVRGVIDILEEAHVRSIITTHYDGIGQNVRRIRVKGLKYSDIPEILSHKNIEEYIDYSFVEDGADKVPEEALSVAKLLRVDEELIKRAQKYLGGN